MDFKRRNAKPLNRSGSYWITSPLK